MANAHYINTQDIRKDLVGFLQRLAQGEQFVVLNRSKPLVTLSGNAVVNHPAVAQKNMQQFLTLAAQARHQASKTPDPHKSYKQLYSEDMNQKYGISGH